MTEFRPDSDQPGIGAFDAAAYIFELSGQLAAMADAQRFSKLAAALELARAAAAEALAEVAVQAQSGERNAATENAA